MKLLILTGKFGMGHFSASRSLSRQIQDDFTQVQVEVTDFFEYAVPDYSHSIYEAFSLLVSKGSSVYNVYYRMTEKGGGELPLLLEWYLLEKMEALLAQRRPDAVIATLPLCAQLVSLYKERSGSNLPLITCITDISTHREWISPGTDCYLVGLELVREGLVAQGVPREKILVSGIPVRPEFRRIHREQSRKDRKELLIMGGGLGLLPRSESFYRQLDALPRVHTTVITGSNQKAYDRLHGRYGNIDVIGYTDQVHQYMAQADLILSKPGGITLFETICSELPLLAFSPFLQQEINNSRLLDRYQIGRVLDRNQRECLEQIRQMLSDPGALERMRENIRRLKAQFDCRLVGLALRQLVPAAC